MTLVDPRLPLTTALRPAALGAALLVLGAGHSAPACAAPDGWEVIEVRKGIEVSRRREPGSPLYGFRGEGEVPVPAATLARLVTSHELALEWVDMLSQHTVLVGEGDDAVFYEAYDMPWPFTDRDFVMHQRVQIDDSSRTFRVDLESVEHGAQPVSDCCVRAHTSSTTWLLQAVDTDTTRISVEIFADPRGALPDWMVNHLQASWPSNTITALVQRAQVGDVEGRPELADW